MSQNEESKASIHQTVLAEVADALKGSNETVRARLKSALVEREVLKRVDLLDKGLLKLREAKNDLNKIRPPVSFQADGTKVEGTFSKADFESLKKAREKVAKLEAALEKALVGQEFDKLGGLVAGKEASPETESE